jgi:CO/xanthine dehydrogenase Mo-binding subunit
MNNIIGKKVKRVDGYEKVTGKAIYGDDIQLKGMLFAACRYTDIPAGKITKLDYEKAGKSAGVKALATFDDIIGAKRIGPIRQDHYPIVKDEVFYSGDVIAVIAAETQVDANEAVNKIVVEYDPIQGLFDPVEAVKKDSRLIHPEFKSNVVVHYPLIKGNVKQGFALSEKVIEREYRTGFHEHAYIEPESVTVVPDPSTKGFKVYGSIQNPFTTRKVVAMFMDLKMNRLEYYFLI